MLPIPARRFYLPGLPSARLGGYPACERRLWHLVSAIDLHARRLQAVEAVPFELPFPGTNFLDRQGTALAGLVERQSAAVQRFHYGGLPPSIAG